MTQTEIEILMRDIYTVQGYINAPVDEGAPNEEEDTSWWQQIDDEMSQLEEEIGNDPDYLNNLKLQEQRETNQEELIKWLGQHP